MEKQGGDIGVIWEEEWWRRMSGPHRFIESASDLLQKNGMVLLQVPEDLSWRYGLRAAMTDKIREWNNGIMSEELDVRDDCGTVSNETEAGRAILEKLEPKIGYRFRSSDNMPRYLCNNYENLFGNRLLWVKGIPDAESCRAFCKLCTHCQRGKIRIVLEDTTGFGRPHSNLQAVRYFDYVSAFDVQLLTTLVANATHEKLTPLWKQYIAVLAANLCEPDTELAVTMVEDYDLRSTEPLDAMAQLLNDMRFSRRGTGAHVLNRMRSDADGGAEYLKQRVWKSQLRLGLPVLEQAVSAIIQMNDKKIQDALDNNVIIQYNKRVTSLDSVGAGTLRHLKDAGYIHVSEEISRQIDLIHDNRNRLAHRKLCTISQMEDIFSFDVYCQ